GRSDELRNQRLFGDSQGCRLRICRVMAGHKQTGQTLKTCIGRCRADLMPPAATLRKLSDDQQFFRITAISDVTDALNSLKAWLSARIATAAWSSPANAASR